MVGCRGVGDGVVGEDEFVFEDGGSRLVVLGGYV